jgi:VanZ family protein
MKKRIGIMLLILLSIGMLFPFYLMRRFSPAYRTSFDWLFHTDISHIIARFIFYGVLTWLASSVLSKKKSLISPFIVILYAFVIAILQESVQLLTGQGPVDWGDGLDVLIDMSGAAIGLFVFLLMRRGKTTKSRR